MMTYVAVVRWYDADGEVNQVHQVDAFNEIEAGKKAIALAVQYLTDEWHGVGVIPEEFEVVDVYGPFVREMYADPTDWADNILDMAPVRTWAWYQSGFAKGDGSESLLDYIGRQLIAGNLAPGSCAACLGSTAVPYIVYIRSHVELEWEPCPVCDGTGKEKEHEDLAGTN